MGFLNKILESVDEKKKGLRKNIKESHDMHLNWLPKIDLSQNILNLNHIHSPSYKS